MFELGFYYLWLRRLTSFFGDRRTRYLLAWLLALGTAVNATYLSWNAWNRPDRLDGNDGHTSIDFASQWLMGKMLALGEGDNLYERTHLRQVLEDNFPVKLQGTAREGKYSDAEELMYFLLGRDEPNEEGRCVGGALYPPLNAFVHWPVGLFNPRIGYRLDQVIQALLAFAAGLAVSRLSQGRLWTPLAAVLIIFYSDFFGNQVLGQNGIITLTMVLWGWVLISRDQEIWGGVVWGLLAYKPVWAMSFFFVLLLTRRWRGVLAMLACGALLAALTLPFVGLRSWLEWRQLAPDIAWGNRVFRNWIFLSRTLFSIPRRWLVDFDLPDVERDTLTIDIVCWALYLFVIELSVRLIVMRGRDARVVRGPGAAFILSAAWLCCFQFMYYDCLVSFPAVIVLFLEPGSWLRPRYLARTPACWQHLSLVRWRELQTAPDREDVLGAKGTATVLSLPTPAIYGWVRNPLVLLPVLMIYVLQDYLIARGLVTDYDPYTIYCVLVLWLWCAWLWTRESTLARTVATEHRPVPATATGIMLSAAGDNGHPAAISPAVPARR
jgi:hypothetical protein